MSGERVYHIDEKWKESVQRHPVGNTITNCAANLFRISRMRLLKM